MERNSRLACTTRQGDMVITYNAAQCLRCGDTIESKHRHDFQSCSCGAVFVDGGLDYLRRGGDPADFRDLSRSEHPLRALEEKP